MEFFVENWIWFLVAGIIILMTLIGYIAEKTDFGRKDIQKKEKVVKEKIKKDKKKEKDEPIEVLEMEEHKPEVQMSLATDSILDTQSDEILSEDDVPEELKVPFGDVSFEKPVEDLNDDTISQPVEEVVSEEPNEELKTTDISTPDIELPDLDEIMSESESKTETEDEDVWNF